MTGKGRGGKEERKYGITTFFLLPRLSLRRCQSPKWWQSAHYYSAMHVGTYFLAQPDSVEERFPAMTAAPIPKTPLQERSCLDPNRTLFLLPCAPNTPPFKQSTPMSSKQRLSSTRIVQTVTVSKCSTTLNSSEVQTRGALYFTGVSVATERIQTTRRGTCQAFI